MVSHKGLSLVSYLNHLIPEVFLGGMASRNGDFALFEQNLTKPDKYFAFIYKIYYIYLRK